MKQFCDCNKDGWCTRYSRDMHGRFREICAGVNVDLGTAAAFREQWLQESPGIPAPMTPGFRPLPLMLKTNQAPGDTVVMTAAIYSLHRAHPGKYLTAVESPYPEVFDHNLDVVHWLDAVGRSGWLPIQMHYPAIHQSNQRAIHFMQGFCEHLGRALGVNVPLLTDRPHLYFRDPPPDAEECSGYWVVCSGGKHDLTNKLWGYQNYAKVLHLLKGIPFVQIGDSEENHPRLHGAIDLVGKTNLRQLFDVIRRAQGVLCGVSLPMHIAAALNKPAIVIAGGREPVAWNAYPHQHYLHTVGMLPCFSPQGDSGACWRSRVVPLGDGTVMDDHPCLRPVGDTPECMTLISPEHVANLIMKYAQRM